LSIQAIAYIFEQDIKPSSHKFVLIALCNYVRDDGTAWASIERISKITSLNRKTVIAALNSLRKMGYIEPTKKVGGQTKKIPVYRLIGPISGLFKNETGPILDRNRPNFGTGNRPNFGTRSVIDPLLIQKNIKNLRKAQKPKSTNINNC
jgi:pyocin large subunit-like protein